MNNHVMTTSVLRRASSAVRYIGTCIQLRSLALVRSHFGGALKILTSTNQHWASLLVNGLDFPSTPGKDPWLCSRLIKAIEGMIIRKYDITEEDFRVMETVVLKSEPHKAGQQWKFTGAFYYATTVLTAIVCFAALLIFGTYEIYVLALSKPTMALKEDRI